MVPVSVAASFGLAGFDGCGPRSTGWVRRYFRKLRKSGILQSLKFGGHATVENLSENGGKESAEKKYNDPY